MKNSFLRLLLPIAALAFIAPGSALAQKGKGGGADSTSGPVVIPGGSYAETYVIDQPGSYVLGGDRAMSDASSHIIQITARDVTLDLGGFALSHSAAGVGDAIFVPNPENVEIRNGSIVAAARYGIAAGAGRGVRVFDLRVVAPTNSGFSIGAHEAVIQRCHVMDAAVYGIRLTGKHNVVSDSIVSNCDLVGIVSGESGRLARVVVSDSSYGISLSAGATLEESTVTGATLVGVYAYAHSTVRGCQITNSNIGLATLDSSVALYENRFAENTMHFSGAFLNAGGNIIP